MPSFELHAIECGEDLLCINNDAPHRNNCFKIVWITAGSGTCQVDLEQMELTPNLVYCITPGQLHHFKANDDARGYVLTFSPDFLLIPDDTASLIFHANSLQKNAYTRVIKVNEEMQKEMLDMLHKMLKEYDNFFLLRSEILRGLLKIFLIYLTRQYEPSTANVVKPKTIDLVNKFFDIVEKKYMTHKLVSVYAEELCITPNHLNEIVKKASGFPASHHIRQRVLLEAKRQAAYSGASMKEIAYNLGFEDISHFSKFFKNLSGLNFTNYKKTAIQYARY
ncbi:transcriptional regulator, AraC family [Chitinophaga sp. YR573]|nr:transcriptional regulator, AraC family [Chitinophaga sp. YR573]